MSEKPFVVNDRRKFTADGDLRPDVVIEERTPEPAATPADSEQAATASEEQSHGGPQLVASHDGGGSDDQLAVDPAPEALPPLTAEQMDGALRAYDATADRLDTAMRAADPGGERMPPMSFPTLVQSLYMQSILQLGGGTEPGQQPRVDLLGARQTIDMLAVVAAKTAGNLDAEEQRLLDSALFEMRMGFLDVTQALARQAATRGAGGPADPTSGPQRIR